MAVAEPIPSARAKMARNAIGFALFQDRQPCRRNVSMPEIA
jgi:hypothetical protein